MSSVTGTWRDGSFTGDLEGYERKALENGISLLRGSAGEPGRGLTYQGLREMDEGGSRGRASLSEEAQWRVPRGAPILGILEDF